MRAWIIAGGPITKIDFYRTIKPKTGDLVICADSGYDNAISFGMKPSVVIGDMDSIFSTVEESCETMKFPCEKDETDTQLAIDYALNKGCKEIIILGALGGRVDHTMANIMLLRRINARGAEGLILSANSRVCLLNNSSTTISRGDSRYLSVIPISSVCKGVFVRRAKYPLENATLTAGETRGISNEFTALDVEVSVKSGEVLIITEV